MRRGIGVTLLVTFALALPASSAVAAELPSEFTASCPTANPAGESYGGVRICSGSVPSFDGARMDVDLTQPMENTGSSHPLIVMLHGFGNDKHFWESTTDEGDGADTHRWNNRWFAKHGYYVLTYTARGFRDDGPSEEHEPPTPYDENGSADPLNPRATLHLKSRDWEIRDTQWLAALVAATYPDVDTNRVAVTGGSYGGIESWLQASQPTWTFPNSLDDELPVLNLQVAVAKYPSTDIAYGLGPNGHGGGPSLDDLYESSQGRPTNDQGDGNPIGVPKESYVTGLFALGHTKGVFEEGLSTDAPFECTYGDCEGQVNIKSWKARTDAGDPTSPEDPIIRQIRRGLTEFRGAYYQDEGWEQQVDGRKVAVFSIQGWTDDLFPAVESFRMFKLLKRMDPRWPVEVALGDVGHSRAQNKPSTWQHLNNQAWQWLQSHINRSHEQQTTVSSEATVCGDGGPPQRVVGRTPEDLANGALTLQYPPGGTAGDVALADKNGLATDAIAGPDVQPGEPCRHSDGPAVGGYTQYSPPLTRPETYVGIGHVRIPYLWEVAPATQSGQLDARLFDVPPVGKLADHVGRTASRTTQSPARSGCRSMEPLAAPTWSQDSARHHRAAHHARHVPLRRRSARGRDPAPAVRQPLAAAAGAPRPGSTSPRSTTPRTASATFRARSSSQRRDVSCCRRLAPLRPHFPQWRTRRGGAGARTRCAAFTGGGDWSRPGSPGSSHCCSSRAGCSRSAAGRRRLQCERGAEAARASARRPHDLPRQPRRGVLRSAAGRRARDPGHRLAAPRGQAPGAPGEALRAPPPAGAAGVRADRCDRDERAGRRRGPLDSPGGVDDPPLPARGACAQDAAAARHPAGLRAVPPGG